MAALIEPRLAAQRGAVAALCRRYGVVALDVFGSTADGRFDPSSSDYDFIARFAPREAGDSLGRRYLAFSEALESLLGRPVDVMTDHPIANPYLRAAVAASRRPFYAEPAAETSA
jgi:predicted nucleotidyltransferase